MLNIFSSYSEDLGGGFEGDMLLPPKTSTRGVAINGAIRRWPNKIIPYDISAITSKFFKKDFFLFISNWIIDANDRTTITNAMNQLMFAVGTPIEGQTNRQACVFFRPAQTGDKEILKIKYGNGCSASVSLRIENFVKSSIKFRLDMAQVMKNHSI